MPLVVGEEGLEKNPNLQLSQWKFLLESKKLTPADAEAQTILVSLMEVIEREKMAPFYDELCNSPSIIEKGLISRNEQLYMEMKGENDGKIQELDAFIEDAEQNLGEMEVRETNLKKAEYLSRIGDKEKALTAFRKTYDKTVPLGQRLDIVFHLIRIGLFYMDHDVITRNVEKAKSLIDEGGDWDRRNRLKVYHATYLMGIRDFKTACELFMETISTFTSYELMDYIELVKYTVITAMIALPRNELHEKVIKGAEIQEVLHGQPVLRDFVNSLYECKYDVFFVRLAEMEKVLKEDRLLNPHYRFYIREMRVKAYTQLLESYSSLTLKYMANSFGVSEKFIDSELHRFIAAGRLHCKIDKVAGVVETNRPDSKNAQYQATIKQGDILLNRIQKLSRVINI